MKYLSGRKTGRQDVPGMPSMAKRKDAPMTLEPRDNSDNDKVKPKTVMQTSLNHERASVVHRQS